MATFSGGEEITGIVKIEVLSIFASNQGTYNLSSGSGTPLYECPTGKYAEAYIQRATVSDTNDRLIFAASNGGSNGVNYLTLDQTTEYLASPINMIDGDVIYRIDSAARSASIIIFIKEFNIP